MKILWITNNILPELCEYLKFPVVNKTGWLHSAANQIKHSVELTVATIYTGNEIKKYSLHGINYFLIPSSKPIRMTDESICPLWKDIKTEVNPDVVHIHGTEYPIGLGYMNACGREDVVISIQGLISEISKYYNFGLSNDNILRYTTLKDVIKKDTLWQQANRFKNRGRFELEYLKEAANFIGRTEWDRAHIKSINPKANYFVNNETLRNKFYLSEWKLENTEKFSIFFSQATYPMKGLHILLEAMPIIIKKFPEAKINVAGFDLTKKCKNSKFGFLTSTTYGYYLYSIINRYKLWNHVHFLGSLTEEEMVESYLRSHIYVNASAIENSSNSIGEAQLLGVPVVASFVGGTDTMVKQNETGLLYQSEDTSRLAASIIKIFEDNDFSLELSRNERMAAQERHNKDKNRTQLLEIYQNIIANKKS